jgi:hypothetical protein
MPEQWKLETTDRGWHWLRRAAARLCKADRPNYHTAFSDVAQHGTPRFAVPRTGRNSTSLLFLFVLMRLIWTAKNTPQTALIVALLS